MDPNTALIVGKQTVSMDEFSRLLSLQGYTNSMPDNQKKYLVSQILQDLIQQKLLLEESEKLGFAVSQDDISAFIRSLSVFQDSNTKQFSFERLKQYLSSQQMNEVEFFQNVRNELTIRNITELMFLPLIYPKDLTQIQYQLENTQFYLKYALLQIQPTQLNTISNQQVDEFLNDQKNDDELKSVYNSKQSQYNQPTQYQVRSILIAHKDAQRAQGNALTRSKLDAKSLATHIMEQIRDGVAFTKLAGEINDDLRALKNNGELGYIDSTTIDSISYEAISQLSSTQPLSSVIDTPYGFRIFQFENKKDGFMKPFEDVKRELAVNLIKRNLETSLQLDFEKKIRDLISQQNNSENIDKLLSHEGITWKALDTPISIKSNFIPELGSSPLLVENLFSFKKPGDVLPMIFDFTASKRAIIKLVSIKKSNPPTENDLKSLQKYESDSFSREFLQAYLKNTKELYESKDKIKINPIIIQ